MSFLMIERAIIECLGSGEKSEAELSRETAMPPEIVRKVLVSLVSSETMVQKNGMYRLNIKKLKEQNQDSVDIGFEVMENLNALVNYNLSDEFLTKNLKFKKVFLNPQDLSHLDGLLREVEKFIDRKKQEEIDQSLSQKTMIFWSYANYGNTLKDYLENY